MLIDWVRSGRTGKYLAFGGAKYFPVRPSHTVNRYIILGHRKYIQSEYDKAIVLQRCHNQPSYGVPRVCEGMSPTVGQQLNSGAARKKPSQEALTSPPFRKFINDKRTLHDMSVISFPQPSPRAREIIALRLVMTWPENLWDLDGRNNLLIFGTSDRCERFPKDSRLQPRTADRVFKIQSTTRHKSVKVTLSLFSFIH